LPPVAATQAPPVGSAASVALGQATQAAARQDSIAPLLQNLGALQGRMASFPRPVVEAALRLLAGRLAVGKTAPDPAQLKQAILRSGVLTSGPAATGTVATDLRTGLLQLRSALLGFLGAEIAPVAAVTRRPPPPTRDSQPRGFRAEPASLPDTATPKEAGRTLLQQTEAALSRIRLLQLASLPQDAARAGAPSAADWTLEVPMLLGNELAIAQLRIAGDGRHRTAKRDREWRLQFSVNFSILGEVGAQIGFRDRRTSIALWAEEPATASALEALLPDLGTALADRGLEVGSLRVGRRSPATRQPRTGQLLDGVR
jgi:hypothetical protein